MAVRADRRGRCSRRAWLLVACSYGHLLRVGLLGFADDGREYLLAARAIADHLTLTLRAVALWEGEVDAQLRSHGIGPGGESCDGVTRGKLLRDREIDQLPIQAEADRAPHVLLHEPWGGVLEGQALVDIAHGLGDAGDHQRGEGI